MQISRQAVTNGGKMPDKYTMYGENRIPPLHLEEIPEKTRSLALIVDDPDAPNGTFNHWLLFNVDPKVHDIKEDCVPVMATQGRNDYGEVEYGGPKPRSGEHTSELPSHFNILWPLLPDKKRSNCMTAEAS